MQRRVAWLLAGASLFLPVLAGTASGSEHTRGTIGPRELGFETKFSWAGPPPPGGVSGPNLAGCAQPGLFCETFDLDVSVPADYWSANTGGVEVEITWPDPADQYTLCVDGTCYFSGTGAAFGFGSAGSARVFVKQASGPLRIRVIYEEVVDDRDGYRGIARFVAGEGSAAIFDEQTPIGFGPATVVSPHFLGPEPQLSVERPRTGDEALDADRIFVDWPMGLASTSSQLHRSEDGGDSFRLLFDLDCVSRNRPTCQTGGGGDSDAAVNPINGNVYFTDLETANVAFASSTNHGDDFPDDRQFAISNPAIAVDRQWVVGVDPATFQISLPEVGATPLQAFLSYDEGLVSKVIQGIDMSGNPIPQPVPQLPDFSGEKGPLLADTSSGPGAGWLYAGGGGRVATVHSSDYQKPVGVEGGWRSHQVGPTPNGVELFQSLALDHVGNAYAVWVPALAPNSLEPSVVMFSASRIADAENDPAAGGWPGSEWTESVRVSLPRFGSAIFSAITAGDEGRIGLVYMATDDHVGAPGTAPPGAEWKTYAAVITNALDRDGGLVVRTTEVSDRVAHVGSICTGGLVGCDEDTGDRSLLDLIDVSFDADGRLTVVSMDNHASFAEKLGGIPIAGEKVRPFAHLSKQLSGPSLFAGADLDIPMPTSPITDPIGDATWPNSGGTNLEALDLRRASLELQGSDLVARIELVDAAAASMTRDLQTYADSYPPVAAEAERLQYVMRFSTEEDIYHLSFEHDREGRRRAFGGRLDDNDRLATSRAFSRTNGAGYHTDDLQVDATLEGETLELTVPAERFGLRAGSRLFSLTAYSMAGPLEGNETTVENSMRTVDASAPLDLLLSDPGGSDPGGSDPGGSDPGGSDPGGSDPGEPGPAESPSPTRSPSPTEPTSPDSAPPAVHRLDLSPREVKDRVGVETIVVATLTGADGHPVAGSPVAWFGTGVGHFSAVEETTDAAGRAVARVLSDEPGDQRVTATAPDCASGEVCMDSSVRHHGPKICDLFGTRGKDVLRGTFVSEVICGFAGDDRLFGGGGNDRLIGSRGDDEVRGMTGRDRVFGGAGKDSLHGGRGRDLLVGGKGRDVLDGGAGRDGCHGSGSDNLRSCRT